MSSILAIANRSLQALALVAMMLSCAGLASAQGTGPSEQPSASDPFVLYHNSLANTVDRVLAAQTEVIKEQPAKNSLTSPTDLELASPKTSGAAGAFTRVQQLRPVIEPILFQEQVPSELAAVVVVESGGQPNALSPKGARGLWQFMPDTARRYGLTVTPEYDERLDVDKSTRAAARYLRDLYAQFGNWQLAFAAYNAGEGAVQRAIDRNGTQDFSRLSSARSLPQETRKYVPAVLDATRIFSQPGSAITACAGANRWKVYAYTRPMNLKEQGDEWHSRK